MSDSLKQPEHIKIVETITTEGTTGFVANCALCPVCGKGHPLPFCENTDKVISELRQQFSDCKKELFEAQKALAETIDVNGKLKESNEKLLHRMTDIAVTIKCIRPHFINTGLSCLEDCDWILELCTKD